MKILVTGATGFLGWRAATAFLDRGHEVVALARPGGRERAAARGLETAHLDAGDPAAQELVAGCDGVLHFAGIPDPARARADPARAVRENVGTTLNLLEGCRRHGAGLVFPSTVRASQDPPPDPYALSKRLGEEACRLHAARAAVVRLTSVFGPGQVAWEGATGAIAAFARHALEGNPLVIPGDPSRTRDFVYVDDVVGALERLVEERRFEGTVTLASGVATPLAEAARVVCEAAGSGSAIETPGGDLPDAENTSYQADPTAVGIGFEPRPFSAAVRLYVDWLRSHPAAEGRARG